MLQAILNKVGRFSDADLALLEEQFVRRQFKKNEVLLAEGAICQSVFLVQTGAVYQSAIDDIDENIIDLYTTNDWVMNYQSFVGQKPSVTQIKAYTDCETLELNIFKVHELIETSPVFFQLGKIMEQGMQRIHFFDNALTPQQKYNYLLDTKPQLLQQFPLKMIASYLKITPETLSRVRANY